MSRDLPKASAKSMGLNLVQGRLDRTQRPNWRHLLAAKAGVDARRGKAGDWSARVPERRRATTCWPHEPIVHLLDEEQPYLSCCRFRRRGSPISPREPSSTCGFPGGRKGKGRVESLRLKRHPGDELGN